MLTMERPKTGDSIKQKYERGLEKGDRKAMEAKKYVTFEPPKPINEAVDKQLEKIEKRVRPRSKVVEGESPFYS
jgi:hypothetical protein